MNRRIAFVSVSFKDGIADCCRRLAAIGYEIVASGGTAKLLADGGISVTPTTKFVCSYARQLLEKHGVEITTEIEADLAGAILDHQVVTVSRELLGGLLCKPKHVEDIRRLVIERIDMVIVDFYGMAETIAKPDATPEEVRDKVDIGGPFMARAAAKGTFEGRVVICDPEDREWVIKKLEEDESHDLDQPTKNRLAAKAEVTVAKYCMTHATYLSKGDYVGIFGTLAFVCKYGENAWQKFCRYFDRGTKDPLAIKRFELVDGTAPSHNTICDLEKALQTITHIAAAFSVRYGKTPIIGVGLKHGNSCGAAIGDHLLSVLIRVLDGDPLALSGGELIVNSPISAAIAERLAEEMHKRKIFFDFIAVPGIEPEAISRLRRKSDKCRFLVNPALAEINDKSLDTANRIRYARGGLLEQPNYTFVLDMRDSSIEKLNSVVTGLGPSLEDDMLLGWAIGSTSSSNTITLVKRGMLIGNAVGQQDRVGAAYLAIWRAKRSKHDPVGSVAYSDSFFPFDDGPKLLIDAGIKAIFTSSGSIRDEDTAKACLERAIMLYMKPDAECRGFYGH